jgi:hypothetical protein
VLDWHTPDRQTESIAPRQRQVLRPSVCLSSCPSNTLRMRHSVFDRCSVPEASAPPFGNGLPCWGARPAIAATTSPRPATPACQKGVSPACRRTEPAPSNHQSHADRKRVLSPNSIQMALFCVPTRGGGGKLRPIGIDAANHAGRQAKNTALHVAWPTGHICPI